MQPMKLSRAGAEVRKIDDALTIESLFDGRNFAFDAVIGVLQGEHPTVINHVSDRAYFILKGAVSIQVGDVVHEANMHDLVVVPKETEHSLHGAAEYLIITAPPFAPENETVV